MVYSVNPSQQNPAVHTQIQDDLVKGAASTGQGLLELINGLSGIITFVSAIGKSTAKECSQIDFSQLKANEIRLVPTSVENLLAGQFTGYICPAEKICKDEALTKFVKDVADEITAQLPRQELNYEVTIKEDDEKNVFILPGGSVVLTTGLLHQIGEDKSKLAAVLSHAFANAADSQAVKQTQTELLLETVTKVVKTAFANLIPQLSENLAGKKDKEESMRVFLNRLEGVCKLGGQIIIEKQLKEDDDFSKQKASDYATAAGYSLSKEQIGSCMEKLFGERPATGHQTALRREIKYLLADLSELI